MNEEVIWEAPPDPLERYHRSKYDPLLKQIKENPGRWGRIRDGMSQSGSYSAVKSLRQRLHAKDKRWKLQSGPVEDEEASFGIWAIYRTDAQMKADGDSG